MVVPFSMVYVNCCVFRCRLHIFELMLCPLGEYGWIDLSVMMEIYFFGGLVRVGWMCDEGGIGRKASR